MINYDCFADIYDIDMGHNIGHTDLAFYLDYAKKKSPVIELGCGTGRIVKPLVDNDICVVGIDNSIEMIKRAKKKLLKCNRSRYQLVCTDITCFLLKKRFKLAICAFSTYSKLLNIQDQIKFFKLVYEHLEPDGILLLDMFKQLPIFSRNEDGKSIVDYKDRWFASRNGWISREKKIWKDVKSQINKIELTYKITDISGKTSKFKITDYTRYSSKEQIKANMKKAGLTPISIFGNYKKDEYSNTSNAMIFEARRTN